MLHPLWHSTFGQHQTKAYLRLCIGTALVLCMLCFVAAFSPSLAFANVIGSDTIYGQTLDERAIAAGTDIADAPDVDCFAGTLETAEGKVLWSRNANVPVPMASTTKIMTCILCIETCDIDSVVTIPFEATTIGESSCYLAANAQCNLRDLLTAMMVKSGNDAATAVAIITGGSVENFVAMMNDKAAELGMANTHFMNPHGLSTSDHYATAEDFCLLARYAMKNEAFRQIVATPYFSGDLGNGWVEFTNGNTSLFTLPDCIGIKTGTEDDAGFCVVTACNRGGLELYAVIFGSSEEPARFQAANALTEWGYRHYHQLTAGDAETVMAELQDTDWFDVRVPVVCETVNTFSVMDYDGAIDTEFDVKTAHGNIAAGDILGTITWKQGDTVLATSRLVAAQDVEAPTLREQMAIWWLRNIRGHKDLNETMLHTPARIVFDANGTPTQEMTGIQDAAGPSFANPSDYIAPQESTAAEEGSAEAAEAELAEAA